MGRNEKKAYPDAVSRCRLIPLFVAASAWFLFHQVFFIGYVPTGSMEPALKKGSCLLAEKVGKDYGKGDVIVFRKGGMLLVKRICAAGGETVDVHKTGAASGKNGDGRITVPKDCFFVMGDSRENSWDSRYWEEPFVKREDVIGKVIFCRKGG